MFGAKRSSKKTEGMSLPEAQRPQAASAPTDRVTASPASPARVSSSSNRSYYSASSNAHGNPSISLPMAMAPSNPAQQVYQRDYDPDSAGHTISRTNSRASTNSGVNKDLPPVAEHAVYNSSVSPTKSHRSTASNHSRQVSGQSSAARSSRTDPSLLPNYAGGNTGQSRHVSTGSYNQQRTNDSISSRNTVSTSGLSHTPSIRSVRSTNSLGNSNHNISSSYPDPSTVYPRRPSVVSNPSGYSAVGVPPSPALTPSEFSIPRPGRDDQIETMFGELIDRIGVQGEKRSEMLAFPIEKKWQLVQAEKANEVKSKERERDSNFSGGHLREKLKNNLPTPSTSSSSNRDSGLFSNAQMGQTPSDKARVAARKDSPEYYLGSFFDKTVDPKKVAHLNVSLRTYEIS